MEVQLVLWLRLAYSPAQGWYAVVDSRTFDNAVDLRMTCLFYLLSPFLAPGTNTCHSVKSYG